MTTKINIQFEECPNPDVMKCHVNFDLTLNQPLYFIINNIEGVEMINIGLYVNFVKKYQFSIGKGRVFEWQPIKDKITEKIIEYLS